MLDRDDVWLAFGCPFVKAYPVESGMRKIMLRVIFYTSPLIDIYKLNIQSILRL